MRRRLGIVALIGACSSSGPTVPPGEFPLPLATAKVEGRVSSSVSSRSLPEVLVGVVYVGGIPIGYSRPATTSDTGGRYSLLLEITPDGSLPAGDSLRAYVLFVAGPTTYSPTRRDSILTTLRYTHGSGPPLTSTVRDFTFPIP